MSEKTNKILYMALSLLLAILFWLYVDNAEGGKISETFYNVPVEFIGETDVLATRGLMLADAGETTITLRLSGPRLAISSLDRDDIRIQVDLTGINAVSTYQLSYTVNYPDSINNSDISIESASRSTVTVQVIELSTKTVPVVAEIVGKVADGYMYMSDRLVLEPSTLTVSGREEDIADVEQARIVLDLTDATSTVEREFTYQLLDSAGGQVPTDGIRVSDKRIEVTAPVFLVKDLDLTIKWKEAAGSMLENVDWEIVPNKITVAGEASSLETKENIILGEVDLSNLLSDTQLELEIDTPANCVNSSGIASATVSIKFINGLETRLFTVTNIAARGLSNGQNFSRITNSVDVVVRGMPEELEELTADDIRIVVDLTEYTSDGTYSVPATVLVDGHDGVGAVGSYTVACKITS